MAGMNLTLASLGLPAPATLELNIASLTPLINRDWFSFGRESTRTNKQLTTKQTIEQNQILAACSFETSFSEDKSQSTQTSNILHILTDGVENRVINKIRWKEKRNRSAS